MFYSASSQIFPCDVHHGQSPPPPMLVNIASLGRKEEIKKPRFVEKKNPKTYEQTFQLLTAAGNMQRVTLKSRIFREECQLLLLAAMLT